MRRLTEEEISRLESLFVELPSEARRAQAIALGNDLLAEKEVVSAVARANLRIGSPYVVVYANGVARLLDATGGEVFFSKGPPALACGLVTGYFLLSDLAGSSVVRS